MKAFKTPLQELAERENIPLMEAQERFINMSADEQDALHKQEIDTYCQALRQVASTLEDPEEESFLKKIADLLDMEAGRAQGATRAYHKALELRDTLAQKLQEKSRD